LAYSYGAVYNYTTFDNASYHDSSNKGFGLDNSTIDIIQADYKSLQDLIKKTQSSSSDVSIGSVIEQFIASNSLTTDRIRYLYNQATARIAIRYGDDLDNISVLNYDSGDELWGQTRNIPGGFYEIFSSFATDLTPNVTLNAVVYSISSYMNTTSGDQMVNVSAWVTGYDNVTNTWYYNDPRSYFAKGVVVAVPLTVLKNNSITFEPALTESKTAAIKKVPVGSVNKILLQWDDPWWNPTNDLIYNMASSGPWSSFINWEKASENGMLICTLVGEKARELEGEDDEAVIDEIMTILTVMYGQMIPYPNNYLVTRWGSVPYIGGAFSYYGVGVTDDDISALQETHNSNIFFAGEHTSEFWLGSVQGAWESGSRASGEFVTFPVWALVEIIVVSAIVLIATIATIIFLKMRPNDSI